MAFLGDDETLDQVQEKIEAIKNVAEHRDQLFEENIDKPMKIAIAAIVGMWAIYHFLIKR